MRIKNIAVVLAAAVIVLFFTASGSLAQVAEGPPHLPGVIEGTGTHFAVTDSEYLNISLDSSENLSARIESMPEMVVLEINASSGAPFANIKLSGFSPSTTYHKYEDDYHNYAPVVTDGNGAFSFEQDVSRDHLIFIQPRKSTKFIKDDATGGDCESIGSWSAAEKTCILNQDINETIQIDDHNITLDGNGHTISGSNTGSGVNVWKNNVTVKNVNVSGFYYGIQFYRSDGGKVTGSISENNRSGIHLNHARNITVSDNAIRSNISYGLGLYYSASNIVTGNTIGPGNAYGISQEYDGNDNVYENNHVFQNSNTGIRTYWGDYITLRDNVVESNKYDGIVISAGDRVTLSGNSMFGNGFGGGNNKSNLTISGGGMDTNDIDRSNTVEGKPVFYEKGESHKTYDGSMDIGSFYCLNCDSIIVKDLTLSEHAAKIFFWHTNNSTVENVTSPDKTVAVNLYYSSNNTFSKNTFDRITILNRSNDNRIYNNNFMRLYSPVYVSSSTGNLFNLELPTGGNFWKINELNCIDGNDDKICDMPYIFSNGADNYPWAKEFEQNNSSCCSSVLFLPGHQASRLYKKHTFDEDQLWEPTNRNEDVEDMYLDPDNGESEDPDIYTRDIIDEAYGVGGNVYKNFIGSMNNLVSEGLINEWKPFPYDWRLPLEDIVNDGVRTEDGSRAYVIENIRDLAANSKTGKVTLIGHSNGGLLAKEIVNELKETSEENLVDRVIMVAVPQLGTPKTVAALLHGDEINLLHGILLDRKTARGFAENMISAYNLLPSKKYFDFVQSPVIEFDKDVKEIYDFRSLYGDDIDNWGEFEDFLLGDNGARSDPDESDTDSPNVLSENFLSQSEDTHDDLDNWQAPEGMEIIQIAGWGLDTIRGIEYDDCDIPFCPDRLSNLDRKLIFTEDGDETVVIPSAVAMGDVDRYYVDMKIYNSWGRFQINRNHASILEVEPLQEFIKNIIQGDNTLTEYITTEKPKVKDEDKRLRFRVYSPVAINIYDENGNHTGLVENNNPDSDLQFYEEQVPNSYYIEFGEKKYAGMDGTFNADIILTGEDLGTFTLEIDEVYGTGEINTTTFSNIPVSDQMKATLSIGDNVGGLNIDINGDDETDFVIQSNEGVNQLNSLEILKDTITVLNIHQTVKDRLINKIDNALKQLENGHTQSAGAMLDNVIHQIEVFSRDKTPDKFYISSEDAEKLIEIIEKIKAMD